MTEYQWRKLMSRLDELIAQVKANTTVVGSAMVLIRGLADKLVEAGTDPEKLAALTEELRTTDQQLADAIAANTLPAA